VRTPGHSSVILNGDPEGSVFTSNLYNGGHSNALGAPDCGAHEGDSPAMKFGITAQ
jgi:hypothetical protein